MRTPEPAKTNANTGFTLVEVMVALAISALLLSGIIQVFFSLNKTNKVSTSLSRMQESARAVTEIISYEAKLTGFEGCIDSHIKDSMAVLANGAPITGSSFKESSLLGVEVTGSGWGDSIGLENIDGTGARNARTSSDILRIQRISIDNMPLTTTMAGTSSNIVVGSNSLALAVGDFAVISNCEVANLIKITGLSSGSGSVTFAHAATGNSSGNLTTTFTDENAFVSALVSNTYFVGETGRQNVNGDDIPALFVRNIDTEVNELVEGVEFMRVLYGQEFSTGNIRYVDASDSDLNMDEVTAIKIAMLLVSNDRILDADDSTRYQLLDTTIAKTGTTVTFPNDRRLRRAVNMTIKLRNRRI